MDKPIKELKAILTSAGVDISHCLDKESLVELYHQLSERLPASTSTSDKRAKLHYESIESDVYGVKIAEEDGRNFCWLLSFLLCVSVRHMRSNPQANVSPALEHWDDHIIMDNEMGARVEAMEYLFGNFTAVFESILGDGSRQLNDEYSEIFAFQGRVVFPFREPQFQPDREQIAAMQLWKTRIIQGIFWIAGYNERGAVFVHYGDEDPNSILDCSKNAVFLVKALANSFTDLTYSITYPVRLPCKVVATYILPFRGQIVSVGIFFRGDTSFSPLTVQQLQTQSAYLNDTVRECEALSRVFYSVSEDSDIPHVNFVSTTGDFRRRVFPAELNYQSSDETKVVAHVSSRCWNAFNDFREMTLFDMQYYTKLPRGSLHEGFSATRLDAVTYSDTETCFMCKSGEIFVRCCKDVHKQRCSLSATPILYCPSVMHPCDLDSNFEPLRIDLAFQVALITYYEIKFTFKSLKDLNEWRDRMYHSNLFMLVSENELKYLGYQVRKDSHGVLVFGEIFLNNDSLSLKMRSDSTNNTLGVLKEICDFCSGLYCFPHLRPISMKNPEIHVSEVNGHIIPRREIEKDMAKVIDVIEGFCAGVPNVTKDKHKSFFSKCFFCGKVASECKDKRLMKCSRCNKAQYCSKEW